MGTVKLVAQSCGLLSSEQLITISPDIKPHTVCIAKDEMDGPAGTLRSLCTDST